MTIDICVVGFGAIGAIYAYALERSGKARVTAICRSNYNTVQEHGVDLTSEAFGVIKTWKPYRVVHTVEEASDRTYAFVVCTFKCLPDVEPTSVLLRPMLSTLDPTAHTAFILLQNGFGPEDDLRQALSKIDAPTSIVNVTVWTSATSRGSEIIQSGIERIGLGYSWRAEPAASRSEIEVTPPDPLDHICEILKSGGCRAERLDFATQWTRWRKLLWNTTFGALCTVTRANVGELLAMDYAKETATRVMTEVLSIARASATPTDLMISRSILPNDIVDTVMKETVSLPQTFKPSMLVDCELGRPMEVEVIVGTVVRRARAVGLPVPMLEVLYASLIVMQKKLLSTRTVTDVDLDPRRIHL